MRQMVFLFLAGGVGALCRFGLAGLVHRHFDGSFPWGTAVVNVLGCLAFGLVWGLAEQRFIIPGQVRIIILTGFMGAFTTFSTFAFETVMLLRDGQLFYALANLAGQNLLGLAAILGGLALARLA